MAIPIKHPPELTGEAAKRFIDELNKPKEKIDFSEQLKACRNILKKSGLSHVQQVDLKLLD